MYMLTYVYVYVYTRVSMHIYIHIHNMPELQNVFKTAYHIPPEAAFISEEARVNGSTNDEGPLAPLPEEQCSPCSNHQEIQSSNFLIRAK